MDSYYAKYKKGRKEESKTTIYDITNWTVDVISHRLGPALREMKKRLDEIRRLDIICKH